MEIAIVFLVKAFAGGLIGHYLKKMLGSVDMRLAELFTRGESVEVIQAYIKEHSLEDQVTSLATKAIDDAVIIPLSQEELPTVEDKRDLFVDVIRIGYDLSARLRLDLLLPGSFVGPDTFSLFTGGKEPIPEIQVEELSIRLPNDSDKLLFVFPKPSEGVLPGDETWNKYRETIKSERQNTKNYLQYKTHFPFLRTLCDEYSVKLVTPGKLTYTYPNIMPRDKEIAINATNGIVSLDAWSDGIAAMVTGLREVSDLQILDSTELKKILKARSAIRDLSNLV